MTQTSTGLNPPLPPASTQIAGSDERAPADTAVQEPAPSAATKDVPKTTDAPANPAAPARVIDENTDMSTLTDQEIMRLMESMGQEEVTSKPLISAPVPLMVIREEYKNGSPQVLKKLDWLQQHGWDQVWRARGDGDCFYRSFTIAYLLRILHDPDPALAAHFAYDAVQRAMPELQAAGFDMELAQDFMDPLNDIFRSFAQPTPGQEKPSEWSLIQVLQDPEKSNSIVVALRLLTSAQIRAHPNEYAAFLFHPLTFEPLEPVEFCRSEVEPCGKEADQVQISALSAALEVGIRIAYLDRSEVSGGDEVINWVEFGEAGEEERPLTLLYRPGHFDVVTKDVLPIDVPDV